MRRTAYCVLRITQYVEHRRSIMKILDIAFKDIQRALRSGFGVVMMFIVPIMIPAIIYAAFGGALNGSADSGGFNLSVTRVGVANLDPAADQSAAAMLTEPL